MLQCLSVCLSVTLCIVAERLCERCVLDQKLLLTAYEKSIYTQMNDLDFSLEAFNVMSTIALHYPLNISETVRDRGWVPTDRQ